MKTIIGKIECTGCQQTVHVLRVRGALVVSNHKRRHPKKGFMGTCPGSGCDVKVNR